VSPILGIIASAQQGALAVGDYESIATTTVGGGGAASVTFSSIPSTYTHLQVRMIARTNRAAGVDPMALTLNSDTGNNYSWHDMYGDGSGVYAEASTSTSNVKFYRAAGSTATAGIFGTVVLDILDYQNSNKYKTIRYLGGIDQNGSGEMFFGSGLWMNSAATTSITIAPFVGTSFSQYSSFALYGIK
jgi:hypothetical protein